MSQPHNHDNTQPGPQPSGQLNGPNGVNTGLTPKRRTRPAVENHDYAAFTRRVLRAHARRIADGDVEGLIQLIALERELAQAIHTAITGLRNMGYSWADIAMRLGITRQAAQQRWGQSS
jgi:hypothetical protein